MRSSEPTKKDVEAANAFVQGVQYAMNEAKSKEKAKRELDHRRTMAVEAALKRVRGFKEETKDVKEDLNNINIGGGIGTPIPPTVPTVPPESVAPAPPESPAYKPRDSSSYSYNSSQLTNRIERIEPCTSVSAPPSAPEISASAVRGNPISQNNRNQDMNAHAHSVEEKKGGLDHSSHRDIEIYDDLLQDDFVGTTETKLQPQQIIEEKKFNRQRPLRPQQREHKDPSILFGSAALPRLFDSTPSQFGMLSSFSSFGNLHTSNPFEALFGQMMNLFDPGSFPGGGAFAFASTSESANGNDFDDFDDLNRNNNDSESSSENSSDSGVDINNELNQAIISDELKTIVKPGVTVETAIVRLVVSLWGTLGRMPNLEEITDRLYRYVTTRIRGCRLFCLDELKYSMPFIENKDQYSEFKRGMIQNFFVEWGRIIPCRIVRLVVQYYMTEKRFPTQAELRQFAVILNRASNPSMMMDMINTPCGHNPTKNLDQLNKYLHTMKKDDAEKSCTICQDEIKEGETYYLLPCEHGFHATSAATAASATVTAMTDAKQSDCDGILPWLKDHNTCPVCRKEIVL